MASFDPPDKSVGPLHGRRLSLREYEAGITALHSNVPANPDVATRKRLAAAELDLLIDYRLGVQFPAERRTALHRIHQHYQKRLSRQLLLFFSHWLLEHGQHRIATRLLRDFAHVLTHDEFLAFFDDAGAPD